jgi:uncharacterized membrane protein YfcA
MLVKICSGLLACGFALLSAPLGAHCAQRMPAPTLRIFFALVVTVVALRLLV